MSHNHHAAAGAALLEASPSSAGFPECFGVYVHVPFCRRRCDYCAFATWTDRHHLMGDYARACATEAATSDLPPATSVYFGGGTPSLLRAADLLGVLDTLALAPDAEVTVECNPDDVDAELLGAYRAGGVTRLSFGAQSMAEHVLVSLGRRQDPAAVAAAARLAGGEGFAGSYSVDLIYGAVNETVDDWRRSVEAVLALDPPPSHVSAYALTVEAGTPLARDPGRHPDSDDQADKYEVVDEMLGDAGLAWYELSNWARPGAESRHNQLYWSQGPYRGIGCSAHSHALDPAGGGSRRWWNVRAPERYQRLVAAGESPEAAGETLDSSARRREGLELMLRTRSGIPADNLDHEPAMSGLVERVGERVVLTRRGRLLANEVALRIRA
ncbi:MAG: radical SAM family heme chaperone HemW [Acidimicrobiales bacterium]